MPDYCTPFDGVPQYHDGWIRERNGAIYLNQGYGWYLLKGGDYSTFVGKRAQEYYSKACVVKDPGVGYWLWYGDYHKNGTGPFKTLRQARQWFLSGGR